MKKWIVIAVAVIAAPVLYFSLIHKKTPTSTNQIASAAAESQPLLRIALEGKYPPFEYLDKNQQLVGFNIDLANALCKEMAVKCSIERYEWDDLIPAVQDKKADAIIATMSITDEREKLVQFTQPYARVPAAYLAKNNRQFILPVMTPERLAGQTIGVVSNTTFSDYLTAEFNNSKVKLKHYPDADALLLAMNKDEVDLVFGDSAVFGEFLRDPLHAKDYNFVGNIIKDDPRLGRGEAIALAKDDHEMVAKFNKALDQLIKSGQYQEMQFKYFTFQIL